VRIIHAKSCHRFLDYSEGTKCLREAEVRKVIRHATGSEKKTILWTQKRRGRKRVAAPLEVEKIEKKKTGERKKKAARSYPRPRCP